MHVLYLHGFASSAQSSKAAFFRSKLAAHGVEVHTPDFNAPDFSTLTVTRMLGQVHDVIQALGPGPVTLVGSSLGGFVAVHAALRDAGRVDRIVLLAPALDFGGNRMRALGDRGIEEWRRTNRLDVFHHAFGRLMPVHYEPVRRRGTLRCVQRAHRSADPDLSGTARYGRRSRDRSAVGGGTTERRPPPAGRRPSAAGEPGDDLERDSRLHSGSGPVI